MNEKTIAAVSLSNRDFPSLEAKVAEAARWVEAAARSGADLVVLPETINYFRGDGPDNKNQMTIGEAALDDWKSATKPLFDVARACSVAVTIPVLTREDGHYANSFFLISKTGSVLGRYQKIRPAPGELTAGVRPGRFSLIEWEGLKVGGAICFDCYFPEVFQQQAEAGADLFLMPSLTPGGDLLNFYALHFSTPVIVAYPAWSRIIDVDGKELAAGGYRNETLRFGFGSPVIMATINFDRVVLHVDINQSRIADIERTYGKKVHVRFDQPNTIFILESRSQDVTVREIVKKFHLVPRRTYLRKYSNLTESLRQGG